MSAVLSPITRPPVDRDGLHWESFGNVPMIPARASTDAAEVDFLGIHTQRHPRRAAGQAHVVVAAGTHGHSFTGWITADNAREIAARLVIAADRADAVAAALAERGRA